MAATKNVQLKKKIAGVMTELFPITLAELVKFSDGKDAAAKIAEIITLINGKTDMAAVNARIQEIVGSAPAALDTLKELGDALNNDPNFAATVTTSLSGKVDKVSGKGLSTEDFTTALKTKLEGLANYSHPSGDGNLHVPATGTTNNGKVLKAGATAGSAAWSDIDYSELKNKPTIPTVPGAATSSADGLMSKDDKSKLDGIATGAQVNVVEAIQKNGVAITPSGKTINITITKSDVGLGNIDNTSDANKPISTATQAALNVKGRIVFGADPGDLTDNDLLLEEIV